MITATNINKSYGALQVLRDVSLTIDKGEVVSIVGASGAGKTTLLQILGTLDRPDSGALRYGDTDVTKLKEKELAAFRNKQIGFVFQAHHLLPEFTAVENVMIPALIGGRPQEEARRRAMELLERLHMADRATHKPAAMSGGECQRVSVARALMNDPMVVLADEPSGNLDSRHARELHSLFFELRKELGQTFVIVTHNEELATMADRKITIVDGRADENAVRAGAQ
ncbi:MAG: ABC transporter ATP-binding protein [Bacteroidales bacterium]|nr:ABC transporter ATP-binding protein [Bacteroidales bacterium]